MGLVRGKGELGREKGDGVGKGEGGVRKGERRWSIEKLKKRKFQF